MISNQNKNGAKVNNRLSNYDPTLFPSDQHSRTQRKNDGPASSDDSVASRINGLVTKEPAVTLAVAAAVGIALGIWIKRR